MPDVLRGSGWPSLGAQGVLLRPEVLEHVLVPHRPGQGGVLWCWLAS